MTSPAGLVARRVVHRSADDEDADGLDGQSQSLVARGCGSDVQAVRVLGDLRPHKESAYRIVEGRVRKERFEHGLGALCLRVANEVQRR